MYVSDNGGDRSCSIMSKEKPWPLPRRGNPGDEAKHACFLVGNETGLCKVVQPWLVSHKHLGSTLASIKSV